MIISVGNRLRSDDGVGHYLARAVAHLRPGLIVTEVSAEGTELLELLQAQPKACLVHAVPLQHEPGTIHRIDAHRTTIPGDFNIAEAIERLRALGQLPTDLRLYGIEGQTFDLGQDLSPAVLQAAQAVIAEIAKDA